MVDWEQIILHKGETRIMFCRFCGKALEDGKTLCPHCGGDNTPEAPAKERKPFPWKTILVVLLAVVLAAVLAWVVYFGVTGRWKPRENDIYYKDSYSVDADKAMENRDQVIAVMGEDTLTNGQLQMFYGMQMIDYLKRYGYGFDTTKPLDTQIYDKETGLTWQQFFMENAFNAWKRYRILTNQAKAVGYQLPALYQEGLDNLDKDLQELVEKYEFPNVQALLEAEVGPGCDVEDYRYYMELYYYGNLYFSSESDKIQITEDELEIYFLQHEADLVANGITKESGILADIRNILICPDGGTKDESGVMQFTQEQWDAAYQEAQALLAQWLAGDKSEESFADLAKQKSEDTVSKSKGGLYQFLTKGDMTTVDVRHALIQPESEDKNASTYTEEQWEACRQKAQQLLDEYLAGEKTEKQFFELAKEHTADGNGSVGGIYTNVAKGYMVAEFDSWIFDESRVYGDTGLVKTRYGYHIMYFVNRDDAVDQWIFTEGREKGNYDIVKADEGYQLLYYAEGEPGWIRYCRSGLMDEKTTQLLDDFLKGHEMSVDYTKITLGEIQLTA